MTYLLIYEGRVTHREFPPVVCEFVDVFPKDLSGLSPIREIKFTIDLVLVTSLISILSYVMSPTKLKELKSQLEKL